MKHIKLGALLFSAAILMTGCTTADSGEDTEKLKADIETLQKQVSDLSDFIAGNLSMEVSDLNGEHTDVFNQYGAMHPIYDDTAVVEAYRTGDASALTDEKDQFILKTAKEVIASEIKDGMTDYEKELAIYNWQVAYAHLDEGNLSAIPSTEDDSHTPYGLFKQHTAICVGNATTFQLFMDLLDIDCKIIHSTEQGEHAWNLVCLDGDWYHVDVTFDGSSNDTPCYTCFNVPDSVKQEAGYPWNAEDFPAATATKYCYAVQSAVTLADIYALPAKIKECLDQQQPHLFVILEKPSDESQISALLEQMGSYVSDGYFYSGSWVTLEDETQIIPITMEYYEDEPEEPQENPDVDPVDYDRLTDCINAAFD